MSVKVDEDMIVVERHVVGKYEFIGIIFREGDPDDQRKFLIAVNGELYRVLYPDLESAMASIVAEKARSRGEPFPDGGPVFPQLRKVGSVAVSEGGMSLRDWYAGQALAGLCGNPGGPFQANSQSGWSIVNCTPQALARECYRLAAAMMTERAR